MPLLPISTEHAGRSTVISAVVAMVLLIGCAPFRHAMAQESATTNTTFRIVAQTSGGISRSFARESFIPVSAGESRTGLSGSIRLIWRPDHMLGIGVESGIGHIVSATLESAGLSMKVLSSPVLLVFVMEKYGADVSVSFGWHRYMVFHNGEHLSSAWEMGYGLCLGYTHDISPFVGIGAELRAHALQERDLLIVQPQIRIQWTISY